MSIRLGQIFLLAVLAYSGAAYANGGCPDIYWASGNNLYVNISQYCQGDGHGVIEVSHKVDKNGSPIDNSIQTFPLVGECSVTDIATDTAIKCRAGGHTPLAGATYKLKKVGTYTLDCAELGSWKMPLMRYIRVSGGGKTAPPYLDQDDLCD